MLENPTTFKLEISLKNPVSLTSLIAIKSFSFGEDAEVARSFFLLNFNFTLKINFRVKLKFNLPLALLW